MTTRLITPPGSTRDRWDERRRWQRLTKAEQELLLRSLNGQPQQRQRQLRLDEWRRAA